MARASMAPRGRARLSRTIPTRSRRDSCIATASLYESTGLNGRSSLRRVRLDTGRVVQRTVGRTGATSPKG